jgi:prophage maintenance system killer protein
VPAEPVWLSLDAVVAINREEAARTGEQHELIDRAALEIAARRPWNVWVYFMDRDFATLAMSLLVALAGARAFASGNEATAYRAAVALLAANGFTLDLAGNRRAEEQIHEYFCGRLSQSGVREWFRMWMSPVER